MEHRYTKSFMPPWQPVLTVFFDREEHFKYDMWVNPLPEVTGRSYIITASHICCVQAKEIP